MYALKSTGKLLDKVKAGGNLAIIAATFARMYLLPVNSKELPAASRLEPSW
jgi:magnesium-protoporphyrin IX monomethyl ester (oxidative) cyclase